MRKLEVAARFSCLRSLPSAWLAGVGGEGRKGGPLGGVASGGGGGDSGSGTRASPHGASEGTAHGGSLYEKTRVGKPPFLRHTSGSPRPGLEGSPLETLSMSQLPLRVCALPLNMATTTGATRAVLLPPAPTPCPGLGSAHTGWGRGRGPEATLGPSPPSAPKWPLSVPGRPQLVHGRGAWCWTGDRLGTSRGPPSGPSC